MSLIKETANFIKELNRFIQRVNLQEEGAMEMIKRIRNRVELIIEQTSSAEGSAVTLLSKLLAAEHTESEVLYIRKDGLFRAAVSLTVLKPVIAQIEPIVDECYCPFFEFQHFNPKTECIYVDSEEQLFKLDSSVDQVCIEVLDHTYRSYKGFTCLIAMYIPTGIVYIIDTIKFRETIPKLRLLRCGVYKLIHCSECVERLHADFGNIGCYRNFSIFPKDIYIDWRIRPIGDTLLNFILEDLEEMVEKVNSKLITEKHFIVEKVEITDFIKKFNLPPDCAMLPELLKLRNYLARRYDEGVQYVLTDSQLLMMLEATPTTIEGIDQLFPRMSSVLRLHAGDFILILRRRAHIFSLERLKEKKCDEAVAQAALFHFSNGKYRRFGKNRGLDERSEEFQISSCEK
ncbi:hypothetical protein PAEPH01_0226 [Pancytospora epiphaga]|nr:hypothetical protein PAEPH01_0226 [Pancytospora epiphaga]